MLQRVSESQSTSSINLRRGDMSMQRHDVFIGSDLLNYYYLIAVRRNNFTTSQNIVIIVLEGYQYFNASRPRRPPDYP